MSEEGGIGGSTVSAASIDTDTAVRYSHLLCLFCSLPSPGWSVRELEGSCTFVKIIYAVKKYRKSMTNLSAAWTIQWVDEVREFRLRVLNMCIDAISVASQ